MILRCYWWFRSHCLKQHMCRCWFQGRIAQEAQFPPCPCSSLMVQVSYVLPGQYLAFLPFGPVCQLCRAGKKLWCPTGTGTEAVETSDGLKTAQS